MFGIDQKSKWTNFVQDFDGPIWLEQPRENINGDALQVQDHISRT